MTLSGPAGGCSVRSERRSRIEVIDRYVLPPFSVGGAL